MTVSRVIFLGAVLQLGACVGQIPKSYTWETVDCQYHREGIQVQADCALKGTAELGTPFEGVLR